MTSSSLQEKLGILLPLVLSSGSLHFSLQAKKKFFIQKVQIGRDLPWSSERVEMPQYTILMGLFQPQMIVLLLSQKTVALIAPSFTITI